MLDNQQQQTDDYSSYKGYQNPSYQNPTSYQRSDTYQNPLESSEEEEGGQSIRNRGGTSPMVQTTPDDIEWDRSLIEKEYKPEDEETRRKNVNRYDKKLFVGGTSGTFQHIDRDELFRSFVEHTIQYFLLHNFKKGSAQNLANQIKNCIVVDGHVTGVIIKYTTDVLEKNKNKKKKKKHGHHHRHHRHHHRHHHHHPQPPAEGDVPPKAEPDRVFSEEDDSEEDEDNGPKDRKGFYIQVGYNITLEAELEKTCLAVFVPFTTYCFGWEPLLDKDYTLHYSLVIRRLRGRYLFNKNINEAVEEAPKDNKTMEKEKGFIGRILNTFLDVAEDNKEKKKEKKEKKQKEKEKEERRHHSRHQRRGHRYSRHSKHRKQKVSYSSNSDSDSDTESGSDSDSDYSSESSSGREHPKKTRTRSIEQPQQQPQQPAPVPDPIPDQQVADQ